MSATYPQRLAQALGLTLDESEAAAVLDLARVVAHGSERRYAPLSTYLAGQFVATRAGAGTDAKDVLQEAVDLAQRVLDADA